jgi:hypothetical protein
MKGFDMAILFEPHPRTGPSINRAPAAISKPSIAAHSMVPETGTVNTAASVFLCLLFMLATYEVLSNFASINHRPGGTTS